MKDIGGFCVVRHDDRVLLVQQGYGKGLWGLPGGAIEPGETVSVGTTREVFEETAVRVDLDGLLGYWEREDLSLFVFLATPATFDVAPPPGEIADAGWFDSDDVMALTPMFSTHRALALHALAGGHGLRPCVVTNHDGTAIPMWSTM